MTQQQNSDDYIPIQNSCFLINEKETLGTGAQGSVFKGFSMEQNKIIAVKFMKKQGSNKKYWERQVQIMKNIQKIEHSSIMDFYGYLQKPQGFYIFIQYCKGGSLKKFLEENGAISQIKAVSMFRQLLEGMTYVHMKDIIHRDLKPDNILLDENDNIKIADYGLAREVDIDMKYTNTGTPIYAAPQIHFQNQNKSYDKKCDVWSVGLILYEMLVASKIFAKADRLAKLQKMMIEIKNGKRTIEYPQKLDKIWGQFTKKMMTFDPQKRPSFLQLLKEFRLREPELIKSINKKYGIQNENSQIYDIGLKISQSVNPYLGRSLGKSSKQIVQEEISYNNFNSLVKFMVYFRMKSNIIKSLIKQFNKQTKKGYPISNVAKIVLFLLTSAAFCVKLTKHMNEIHNKKIKLPEKLLTMDSFIQEHQVEIQKLVEEFKEKDNISIVKYKRILKQEIIPKIKDYLNRDRQKKVLLQLAYKIGPIDEYAQEIMNENFKTEEEYMACYKKIINLEGVGFPNSKLHQLNNEEYLKTYALIRTIGSIDTEFPQEKYQRDDFVAYKKQQLENSNSEELIEIIKRINFEQY